MMPRFILVLFALGFLCQGCTFQKRSLMPGWHVERAGQVSNNTDAPSPEMMLDIATEKLNPPT